MLNAGDSVGELPAIIDYHDPVVAHQMANGQMNTAEARIIENLRGSIRRGHTQFRTGPNRGDRICIVGSGPSLESTLPELRQLLWEGATLVTLNGAYHWCIEHNLRPQTQIVMDARPSNARFVTPEVPKCNYLLASQCAPEVWDAVQGYPNVWIWHAVIKAEGATSDVLDSFYGGQWIGIGGGTTVFTRALYLLRTAGYLRFDAFGIDCCWMGDQHHAIAQPENDGDRRSKRTVRISVRGADASREFEASGWHAKQLEDVLASLYVNGKHFQLNVHGDGMLAHVMRVLGTASLDDLVIDKGEQ